MVKSSKKRSAASVSNTPPKSPASSTASSTRSNASRPKPVNKPKLKEVQISPANDQDDTSTSSIEEVPVQDHSSPVEPLQKKPKLSHPGMLKEKRNEIIKFLTPKDPLDAKFDKLIELSKGMLSVVNAVAQRMESLASSTERILKHQEDPTTSAAPTTTASSSLAGIPEMKSLVNRFIHRQLCNSPYSLPGGLQKDFEAFLKRVSTDREESENSKNAASSYLLRYKGVPRYGLFVDV